jgi:hypothetical protein
MRNQTVSRFARNDDGVSSSRRMGRSYQIQAAVSNGEPRQIG